MQKKFLRNLVLLVFLNLLVKPFWILGVDRQVQNVVGPEEYGLYFTIFNFSFLFYIFLDLGITNFNNRNIKSSATKVEVRAAAALVKAAPGDRFPIARR